VAALLGFQYYEQSAKSEDGKPAKEIVGEALKKVACTPSTVYDDGLKKDLDLPKKVVADETKQVATAIQVHAAMHAHTVTAVKDLDDGETELFVRHDPLPWLAFDHSKYISVTYAYDNDGPITMVGAGMSLMQVKLVDFSAVTQFDDRGNKLIGVEARAEF